ncbi:MAG: hypothetical protein WBY44_19605 [Bryobacteraceae bacterium]|jgi:hypothetical protein
MALRTQIISRAFLAFIDMKREPGESSAGKAIGDRNCNDAASGSFQMSIGNFPVLFFALCFFALWLSAETGTYFHRRWPGMDDAEREDLGLILGAALTLLGLIIGFTFSMAVSRYDLRKNYEEAEANAIGTEYLRAELLPSDDAARVRDLLRNYVDQRILFYTTRDPSQLETINSSTARLQRDLWSAVKTPAVAQPTAVAALAVSGMNDVLNSQGYTQAAWWNRIPTGAWILLVAIGVCCNVLFGYHARRLQGKDIRFFILPLIVAVSFFLIADLDSPHGGLIRVIPQNLVSLAGSIHAK